MGFGNRMNCGCCSGATVCGISVNMPSACGDHSATHASAITLTLKNSAGATVGTGSNHPASGFGGTTYNEVAIFTALPSGTYSLNVTFGPQTTPAGGGTLTLATFAPASPNPISIPLDCATTGSVSVALTTTLLSFGQYLNFDFRDGAGAASAPIQGSTFQPHGGPPPPTPFTGEPAQLFLTFDAATNTAQVDFAIGWFDASHVQHYWEGTFTATGNFCRSGGYLNASGSPTQVVTMTNATGILYF